MSWNNKQHGGQNKFPKKMRPGLPDEHAVPKSVELVIDERAELRNSQTIGKEIAKETISFKGMGMSISVEAFKAAMMTQMSFGIPHDHPEYPNIIKHDTKFPSNSYFAQYLGRIKWTHDPSFWHIPCFTRYVIDKFGRVLNALNGMEITKDQWGNFDLAPDAIGTANKTTKVQADWLKMLAFRALPSDFIDYGFRNYSHELKFCPELKVLTWVKRSLLVIKDNMSGDIAKCYGVKEFDTCYVSDFNSKKELWKVNDDVLQTGMVNTGSFSIRLEKEIEQPPMLKPVQLPVYENTTDLPTSHVAPETEQEPAKDPGALDTDFDDDFNF